MDNRAHIVALFIDLQMHGSFRRRSIPLSGFMHLAMKVHHDQIVRFHASLGKTRGRDQHQGFIEADRNIAVIGSH